MGTPDGESRVGRRQRCWNSSLRLPCVIKSSSCGGNNREKEGEGVKKWSGLSGFDLKLLAMLLMLCDHLWATIIPGNNWLNCVGRLAFPIFAFQIAEGWAYTSDRKQYRHRVLVWALISEIPFNLMAAGGLIYPFHQNVMFTFWLSMLFMERIDRAEGKGRLTYGLTIAGSLLVGYLVGFLLMVDYYGYGVVTVLVFHLARKLPYGKLIQLAGIGYLNLFLMKGLVYPIVLFGREWLFPQQGFALLALPLIWLYNGRAGTRSKAARLVGYAFYPVHMLILALLALLG